MKEEDAEGIIKGAFRTVYPGADYAEMKADRWRNYRSSQALFLKRSIESYQEELVKVVFYSGFRSLTASKHMPTILKHLGDPRKAADYSEKDLARMLADDGMIKNQSKIRACINNARTLLKVDRTYGSFNAYVRSFGDHFPEDKDGTSRLLEDLKKRFKFIGPRTGRHFLMNIGFPLVKPDIMIMRVLFRLGLVSGEDGEYIDKAVNVCLEIAQLVDLPPTFVDELLVKVGQSEGAEICKKREPVCGKCALAGYCRFPGAH